MLELKDRELYEKIAGMLCVKVPQNQIAEVVGLSEGRVSQIKELPEFKELYAIKAAEHYEERQTFDKGWDTVEQLAMAGLIKRLQVSNDPDFALKAAMVANKALRRNSANGNQVIPATVGGAVIIQMNNTFIDKLQAIQNQQVNHIQDRTDGETAQTASGAGSDSEIVSGSGSESNLPQKRVNMLEPGKVDKLFGNTKQIAEKFNHTIEGEIEAVFTPSYVSA